MRQLAAPALAAFAVALVFTASPAVAQQVYKWKDARGVTHYSEKPPASGQYTTQDAVRDPATAAPASASATDNAPSAADSRCTTARRNLANLQTGQPVQMDSDGDGKLDQPLTDTERSNQMELARSTLKAYNCTETAAAG